MDDQEKARAIDRFEIRSRLGAGAMGVVFEAYDRERERVVALKTLPNAEANALYRFKREFRTLADISHPNLVNLYELFIEPESCFFTMEKVDGTNFLAYVRPESEIGDLETLAGWASHLDLPSGVADTADDANPAVDDGTDPAATDGTDGTIAASRAETPLPTARHPALAGLFAKAPAKPTPVPRFRPPGKGGEDARNTATATSLADIDTEPGSSPRRPILEDLDLTDDGEKSGSTRADQPVRDPNIGGPLNVARLREAIRQLAGGVAAIHAAGKLHRDLKPSNVMVTSDGRVVILDFGLATELASADGGEGLTGTAAYMAPEQVEGQALPASDWYAIGVMLFEALTGRRPFTGSLIQVLMDKRRVDAPRPDELAPTAPADLADLCARLLARDPEARPQADEILAILGARERSRGRVVAAEIGDNPLVGRERQLAELRDAAARAAAGEAVATYVHGPSGTGKTALVRHFISEQRADPDVLVLQGRCYVHESVPYKALDGVVDSLSRLLVNMPEEEARVLLPRDLWALARIFPVMSTVLEALMDRPMQRASFDRLELRRKAFAALRDLLGRLSDRRKVILYIDDLQWADADSAILLDDLLREPAPALLLLATFRSEEIDAQPFLRELLAKTGTEKRRSIPVTPLSDAQLRELVGGLLGPIAEARAFVPTIVREAAGSPFLAEQLALYVLHGDDVGATGVGLGEMLAARLASQPEGAAELVNALAVASHPLPSEVAAAAAALRGDERPLVKSLVNAKLLRRSGADERLELYHDRIRETFRALLDPESVRGLHRTIAGAMEKFGLDDPEALYGHYRGAGDRLKAALFADRAAAKASEALAFDQAALFFRRALELAPTDGELPEESATASRLSKARLERGLGDALANAGRCREAAHAYLRAAGLVDAQRGLELRRAAAEQLLSSGHLDEGREVLGEVLAQAGLRLAPSPKRALLSLVTRRIQLKLRGYNFAERPAEQVPPDKLHLIDICWAVSTGLSMIDNIRGNDYAARGLLLALEAGEPIRVANAMSMEAGFLASGGDRGNRAQAFQLSKQACELAEKIGSAAAIAQTTMIAAACNYLSGLWRRAIAHAGEADVMLRERCPGAIWQKATAQRFGFGALMYAGEIGELVGRLPFALRDAEERGNLYSDADLKARLFMHWLARDATGEHRDALAEVFRRWTSQGYHIQHFNALRSLIHGDLYDGDHDRAEARYGEQQASLEGSMLLRVQLVRGETHQLKAMIGLARLAAGKVPSSKRRGVLKAIDKEIKGLHGEGEPWCTALADLLRAGLCRQSGDDEGALRHLTAAHHDLGAADMALHAAVAERALGHLLGGDAGAAHIAKAEAWMRAQAIVDPARVSQALGIGLLPPV